MQADKSQPELEYLLVLDFEATCIEDKKPQPCSQIIQFPIIVVHLPTGKKLDVFHQYVKPTFNPQLTPFCTQLTGITQKMVNSGISIEQTLEELDKWFNKLNYLKEGNYTIVTCGDWDLNNCLKNQAKHKKLYIRKYLRSYINIKKYCAKVMGLQKVGGMMHMLQILNLKHQGKHHSGIDDVSNICNICIELSKKYGATFPKAEINNVRFYLPADNNKPQIKYLLVLDFEATCVKNNKIYPCPQIIEFPVILIDTHQNKKIDTFHQYIKPTLNPQLTEFCTQLTGITQDQVNKGITIQETLINFDKWLKSKQFLQKGNFCFVTCGDWDICTCLRLQARTKSLKLGSYFQKYINIKNYFIKVVRPKDRVNGMMEMLKQLGLKHEGKHHSGIDDVTNISNICIELVSKHHAKFPKNQIRHIQLKQ